MHTTASKNTANKPPALPAGLRTLRDYLRYAVSEFNRHPLVFGHGNDNAWDEAVYLLLDTLHLPPETLDTFLDARLTEHEAQDFVQRIHRRTLERIPAAYIAGKTWLQGVEFFIDERAIIPRSHIAELLAEGLAPWVADPDNINSVLDMCTGSGCLAILAALTFPQASIDAVDLSEDALALACRNIAHHKLEDRVQALHSNLFEQLSTKHTYDLIICNPPYVNQASMEALPPEYLHEPQMALAGGNDGMDLVRRILLEAPRHMRTGNSQADTPTATPLAAGLDDSLLILEIGNEYSHFCQAFPFLEPVWLETANTDDAVLLLTRTQLLNAHKELSLL